MYPEARCFLTVSFSAWGHFLSCAHPIDQEKTIKIKTVTFHELQKLEHHPDIIQADPHRIGRRLAPETGRLL